MSDENDPFAGHTPMMQQYWIEKHFLRQRNACYLIHWRRFGSVSMKPFVALLLAGTAVAGAALTRRKPRAMPVPTSVTPSMHPQKRAVLFVCQWVYGEGPDAVQVEACGQIKTIPTQKGFVPRIDYEARVSSYAGRRALSNGDEETLWETLFIKSLPDGKGVYAALELGLDPLLDLCARDDGLLDDMERRCGTLAAAYAPGDSRRPCARGNGLRSKRKAVSEGAGLAFDGPARTEIAVIDERLGMDAMLGASECQKAKRL